MDMTWLGHACFRMRGREGVVLTDPPDPKSGHAIPKTEASLVTMSHDHPGHASLRSVGGEPVVLRGPGEYEVHEVLVTGVSSFHDEDKGTERGRNTVFAIRLDDLVVPMSYDPDEMKKDTTPYMRLLHELGVKELVPVPKLSVTRSTLPDNLQVVALDSRAR